MVEKVCSNPSCRKNYPVQNLKHDDGFCCFDCWEKVNCKEPQEEVFEDITQPIV